jgi:predicted O-methyltransferase YrrM
VSVTHTRPSRFKHPVFVLLGLRPAFAQHSSVDEELLVSYCAGRRTIVELGVAEGGSAVAMRRAMDAEAVLHLIDPFFSGRIPRVSVQSFVARRLVRSVSNGRVVWMRTLSEDAGLHWTGLEVDLLYIDADHRLAAVQADLDAWSPHLAEEGVIVFDDAGREALHDDGPRLLVAAMTSQDGSWRVIGEGDRYVAVCRR